MVGGSRLPYTFLHSSSHHLLIMALFKIKTHISHVEILLSHFTVSMIYSNGVKILVKVPICYNTVLWKRRWQGAVTPPFFLKPNSPSFWSKLPLLPKCTPLTLRLILITKWLMYIYTYSATCLIRTAKCLPWTVRIRQVSWLDKVHKQHSRLKRKHKMMVF